MENYNCWYVGIFINHEAKHLNGRLNVPSTDVRQRLTTPYTKV